MGNESWELTPSELKDRMDQGDAPLFIDVREAAEREAACIPGTVHIPLGEVVAHLGELDPKQFIVAHCRSGVRSMQVVQFLRRNGYRDAWSLSGGILAWSAEIDPTIPTY